MVSGVVLVPAARSGDGTRGEGRSRCQDAEQGLNGEAEAWRGKGQHREASG